MSKPRVIIELEDLIEQATKERSHYYVKSVCEKSILAIGMLQHENETIAKAYDTLLQAAREMEASLNEVQNNGARASDGKWSVISQSLYSFRAVLKELGEA